MITDYIIKTVVIWEFCSVTEKKIERQNIADIIRKYQIPHNR